jgi:hypothetical protein
MDARASACVSAVEFKMHEFWVKLVISSLSLFWNIDQFALVLVYLEVCDRVSAGSFREQTMTKWSVHRLSILFIQILFKIFNDMICRSVVEKLPLYWG